METVTQLDRGAARHGGPGTEREMIDLADPQSIDYLTGVYVEPFERLFALCLRTDGSHVFFLNKLFSVPETPIEKVWFTDTDDSIGMLAQRIQAGEPLGIDKEWPARFLLPLMERLPGTPCQLASDCVDSVRARKDAAEQELMRMNSRLNDEAMTRAAAYIREGMTEAQVADFLLAQYKELGCQDVSFPPIVSFGANAADPTTCRTVPSCGRATALCWISAAKRMGTAQI